MITNGLVYAQRNIGRLLTIAVLLLALVGYQTTVWAGEPIATGVTYERSYDGPGYDDGSGTYVPGEEITIQVEFTNNSDFFVTAIAFTDEIPDGWSVASVTTINVNGLPILKSLQPAVQPAIGSTGTLEFLWIDIPPFPFTLEYSLDIPAEQYESVEFEGMVEYRYQAGPLFYEGEDTLDGPPCISFTRTADDYVPGQEVEISVSIDTSACTSSPFSGGTVYSLGIVETIPEGWELASVGGADAPFISPPLGTEDELEFGWVTVPPSPIDFTYTLLVPGDETDDPETITGPVLYYLDGDGKETPSLETDVERDDVPEITLVDGDLILECGDTFVEPGFSATDEEDGDLTSDVLVGGDTVNTSVPNIYVVTYDVTDSAGQSAPGKSRNVTVLDTTSPTLELIGDDEVTVECGTSYNEQGATASDVCDSELDGGDVFIGGDTVDTTTVGTYEVTYTVFDFSQNSAEVSRLVHVVDTTAPVISLIGQSTYYVECGVAYVDPGADATDTCDSDPTIIIDITDVDPTTPGQYTVTITAIDASGNSSTATRTVIVEDLTAPVVTILAHPQDDEEGEGEGLLPEGEFEGDLDKTAIEGQYEGLFEEGEYEGLFVEGEYEGQTLGEDVVILNCGDRYVEACPVALDNCDGLIEEIEITGVDEINPFAPGEYTITYAATDSNGNTGYAYRTVIILENCEAVIDQCLLDPFACSEPEETVTIPGPSGCTRNISLVHWDGSDTTGNVTTTVEHPDDPTRTVTVTVPKSVIPSPTHEAVLVVIVGCDLVELFDPFDVTELSSDLPSNQVSNAPFAEVSIITRDQDYDEIEDLTKKGTVSGTITFTGLELTDGFESSILSHTTSMTNAPGVGLQWTPEAGSWSDSGIFNVIETAADTVQASFNHLSTFTVFEAEPVPTTESELVVVPSPVFDLIVGILPIGESASETITLTNTGAGVVNGTASLIDPNGVFSITDGGLYSLGSGQSDTIEITFTPTAEGDFEATLELPGGDNGTVSITLKGTGTVLKSPLLELLGCGPVGNATGSPFADMAVLLGTMFMLLFLGRKPKPHLEG